jgi:hypothetical protein
MLLVEGERVKVVDRMAIPGAFSIRGGTQWCIAAAEGMSNE